MSVTKAPVVATGNPFVGPRSFGRHEKLHGRDREIRELLNLIVADRIVLCYSPSGAGKTSLIEAGLTAKLEEEGFCVLPTIRLKHEPPAGATVNRYVASALACLGVAPDQAGATLREGLCEVAMDEARTGLVVFDQFEEVLSLDPTDATAKRAFFSQLGEVLRDRRWWALLAMREDYLAALDPYLPLLPTRLATRFRLDLLGPEAARQVVTRTVEATGRTFTADASAVLVTELSRMVDGRIGPYVEPVQLQVVCRQLWERLPAAVTEITTANMGDVGDVDGALAAYYGHEVQGAAEATGTPERIIRDWFEHQLITDRGHRGQAQAGPDDDMEIVRLLQDSHLVRAESRRGSTWYELAHDRLVAPVRADNNAWAEEHLTVFQRQADLWEKQGHRDDLLVTDEILDQGESLAAAPGSRLSPAEQAFLGACRRTRKAAERERRSVRRTRQLLALANVGLVVAVIASVVAFRFYDGAKSDRDTAKAGERRRLVLPALEAVGADPNLSVHLALRVLRDGDDVVDDAGRDARSILLHRVAESARIGMTIPVKGASLVAFSPDGEQLAVAGEGGVSLWGARRWTGAVDLDSTPVNALAYSPDGRHVASASVGYASVLTLKDDEEYAFPVPGNDERTSLTGVSFSSDGTRLALAAGDSAWVWDWAQEDRAEVDGPPTNAFKLTGHTRVVRATSFRPDGGILATAGDDGTVKLWNLEAPDRGTLLRTLRGHVGSVQDVAFSPDGATLVTAGEDGTVRIWDPSSEAPGRVVSKQLEAVNDVTYSQDGRRVATAGQDGTARVVDPVTGRELVTADPGTGAVTGVAFDPTGSSLALATADGAPAVWDVTSVAPPGHTGSVYSVAFSPEGDRLATASSDGTAAIWDRAGTEQLVLTGHDGEVNSVVFGPAGVVVTASDDATAKQWDAVSGREVRTFAGHKDSIYDVALNRDTTLLATASQDGTARIWDLATGAGARPPIDTGMPLNGVAFSPDGRRLATAGDDGTMVWDIVSGDGRKMTPGSLEGAAQRVAFSPDGTLLAATTGDGETSGVTIWDPASGRLRREFETSFQPLIAGVAFSPDGTRLVAADGVVRNVSTGAEVVRLAASQGVAFSPDGREIATAGEGTTVRSWDAATGGLLRTLGAGFADPFDEVGAVATDDSGRLVATAGGDGTARLWDSAGQLLTTFTSGDDWIADVALSPGGRRLVTSGDDGRATVWDVGSGKKLAVLPSPTSSPASGATTAPTTVAPDPEPDPPPDEPSDEPDSGGRARFVGDEETVVVASGPGDGATVWGLATPSSPDLIRALPGQVVGLSDNGRWLAALRGGSLVVVDTTSGRVQGRFQHAEAVSLAAISANGRRLIAVDDNRGVVTGAIRRGSGRSLRVLDVPKADEDGAESGMQEDGDEESSFLFVAASPDGATVAAASGFSVVAWHAGSGDVLFEADGPAAAGAIAFTSDGRLAAGGEARPYVYPVQLPGLKTLALASTPRPLVEEECDRYLQEKAGCSPQPPPAGRRRS